MAEPKKLVLYNTLSRKKEEFEPINPPKVGFYSCGPTVYNFAHIGNLRAFVFADTLKRLLRMNQYEVTHVMNITDVGHLVGDGDEGEDKMESGAAREGKNVWEIARYYTDAFMEDIHALNIIDPDVWCKATEHIQEQIAQVEAIERKGLAYTTDDGVYFDTAKLDDYGKLAQLNIDELQAGARVEMGGKKNKTDFALWKFSPQEGPKRAMEWESPWGVGFPGWHIECSAMSSKYLGEQFDIHTGGIDHIPVHHTNEIAQAETAFGKKPWVKYWLHNEFLIMGAGKMSKSSGEFLHLKALVDKGYAPLVYRYFLLTAHYRQQLTFSFEAMDGAKASYERLKNIVEELHEEVGGAKDIDRGDIDGADIDGTVSEPYFMKFLNGLNDDINTPQALAVMWEMLRDEKLSAADKLATVGAFDEALGLSLLVFDEVEVPDEITALAEKRQAAREAKDWAASDKLRDELQAKGWRVADTKDGYKLKKL